MAVLAKVNTCSLSQLSEYTFAINMVCLSVKYSGGVQQWSNKDTHAGVIWVFFTLDKCFLSLKKESAPENLLRGVVLF